MPRTLLDGTVAAVKILLSVTLTVLLLAGGQFASLLWDESANAENQAGRRPLAEPVYDIWINENENAILLRTRHGLLARNLQTGELLRDFTALPVQAKIAAWVPQSGQILAGCVDGRVIMLEHLDAPIAALTPQVHKSAIVSLAVSNSGTIAATGSKDCVCLWDLKRRQLVAERPLNNSNPARLQFSRDDDRLLVGSRDGLRILQADDLSLTCHIRTSQGPIVGAAFLDGGQKILAVHLLGALQVHDLASGEVQNMAVDGLAHCLELTVSTDGRYFTATDRRLQTHLYSLETFEKITRLEGDTRGVSAVVFSENEPWMFSAGYDGMVRVWDLESLSEMDSYRGSLPVP